MHRSATGHTRPSGPRCWPAKIRSPSRTYMNSGHSCLWSGSRAPGSNRTICISKPPVTATSLTNTFAAKVEGFQGKSSHLSTQKLAGIKLVHLIHLLSANENKMSCRERERTWRMDWRVGLIASQRKRPPKKEGPFRLPHDRGSSGGTLMGTPLVEAKQGPFHPNRRFAQNSHGRDKSLADRTETGTT